MPLPMTVPTTTAVAWLRRRSRASSGRASVVCGLVAMEGAKSIVENLAILLRQGEDLSEAKDLSSDVPPSHLLCGLCDTDCGDCGYKLLFGGTMQTGNLRS